MRYLAIFCLSVVCAGMLLPASSFATNCNDNDTPTPTPEPDERFRILGSSQKPNAAPMGLNIPGFGGVDFGVNPCQGGVGSDPIFNQ